MAAHLYLRTAIIATPSPTGVRRRRLDDLVRDPPLASWRARETRGNVLDELINKEASEIGRLNPKRTPTMPSSRKCRSSQTNPPVTLQEGRPGNHHNEQWNAQFKELLDYRSQHGDCNDCNVPVTRGKLGLGQWVGTQRGAYGAKSLEQDHIDRLSRIGFKWMLREGGPKVPWETRWEVRFDELVQYKAKHGNWTFHNIRDRLGGGLTVKEKFTRMATSTGPNRSSQWHWLRLGAAKRSLRGFLRRS